MPRPVLLFSGPFADLPLDALAAKAGEWGYAGLELCCWGDHLEVQHALGDADYCSGRLSLLANHDLQAPVIANHRVGQAVCDRVDERHKPLVPDYVWGDGDPEGIRARLARAEEELRAKDEFQHVIVNDDLGRAAAELSDRVATIWPRPNGEGST